MSELRPWLRPYVALADFLSHRRWVFWTVVLAGGFAACVFLSLVSADREAGRAADRLAGVEPVTATEVLWHVVDGQLEGVAVVVPGPGAPFTVDLAGVDGSDVDAYDGWQPAPAGVSGDYAPPLLVRVDLTAPPVAMREADVRDYEDGIDWVVDLVLGLLGVVAVVTAIVVSARQDRQLAPPRRRRARHS